MALMLQIQLTDGTVYRYRQDDPATIARTLDALEPRRVFEQAQLMIHGFRALTAYRVANIEALRIECPGMPQWPHLAPMKTCREIVEEEFERRRRDEEGHEQDRPEPIPGEVHNVYLEFRLRSGAAVFAHGEFAATTPLQERTVIQHIFERKYFQAEVGLNGVLLLNPANVIRYALYPGPAHPPSFALDLHRV